MFSWSQPLSSFSFPLSISLYSLKLLNSLVCLFGFSLFFFCLWVCEASQTNRTMSCFSTIIVSGASPCLGCALTTFPHGPRIPLCCACPSIRGHTEPASSSLADATANAPSLEFCCRHAGAWPSAVVHHPVCCYWGHCACCPEPAQHRPRISGAGGRVGDVQQHWLRLLPRLGCRRTPDVARGRGPMPAAPLSRASGQHPLGGGEPLCREPRLQHPVRLGNNGEGRNCLCGSRCPLPFDSLPTSQAIFMTHVLFPPLSCTFVDGRQSLAVDRSDQKCAG